MTSRTSIMRGVARALALCTMLALVMTLACVSPARARTAGLGASGAAYEGASSAEGSWQYQVSDQAQGSKAWTVECRSGVAGEGGKLLRPAYSLSALQTTLVDGVRCYTPVAEIVSGGQTYHCVQDRVTLSQGGGNLTVYYVPEGYALTEDYTVTIRYVNIANPDGAPIESFDHVVPASKAATQPEDTILIPGSIKEGAYVLVPGQLFDVALREGYLSFCHSCYAPERTYTFYYRAINDVAHANTVLERVGTLPATWNDEQGTQELLDEATPLAAPTTASVHSVSSAKSIAFGGLLGCIMASGVTLFAFFAYKKELEDREGELSFE